MTSLEFVLQDQAQDDTHHGDNQTTQEGGPEAVDGETNAKGLTHLPGKPEQEGVDQQREQAQGQEDKRAGQ